MRSIGIIDSGIGGLSILTTLIKLGAPLNFFYQSDHSNVPYGEKSQDFMYSQTKIMVEKLLDQNVDLILLACNTLTAQTIDKLRSNFPIPFVGIEPFVNFINTQDYNTGEIGIILTPATANSSRYKELKKSFDPQDKIKTIPLNNLALIIEKLSHSSIEDISNELIEELECLKELNLETLIYGCTHYPLIDHYIKNLLKLNTIDPHLAVAKRVLEVLDISPISSKTDINFHYASEIKAPFQTKSLKDFSFIQI